MNDSGIFISGIFISCEEKNVVRNDVNVKSYYYLVAAGNDPYKIKCDHDYRNKLKFGDQVDFRVKINTFNNNVYFSGELWEDA